ncbi:MAG: hypothetical protein RL204_1069 [Bacteroidota bacterium]|jgi:tetratricopeptide (TPR) repeat protein
MRKLLIVYLITVVILSSCGLLIIGKSSDAINNPKAREYFRAASDLQKTGGSGFQEAKIYLDSADILEPNNAMILHERGLLKFNANMDVKSAFVDLGNSILYTKEQKSIGYRYLNRGLCYMEICDVKSACDDWKKAGELGLYYVDKYCKQCSDTIFGTNSDERIELHLDLVDTVARILSTHNSPSMTECLANINLKNNNVEDLGIYGAFLDYGLSGDSSSMFLEAQDQFGKKFIFFTQAKWSSNCLDNIVLVEKGQTFQQEENITQLHQFSYTGVYKVRVAIRPTSTLRGIDKTYYSNWETLVVE